ncbi:hypothetical protein T4E_576 [Trichinella pseudospiralis]|uniref:Uncharacterized protein n=1 Tax=Trichinella pseudospiralis TaxID=6337 RepID=A0A0V1FBE7_TRIPS|nr:hypothetical protein T4E_5110 [Trichinella pseudospiralis]KRX87813.1 hypothetical protein T4E_576 [Trichinella pseudospiralis]KRY82579.1 hypothetical protein T4D_2889 [Trichinella pseudospiralis]
MATVNQSFERFLSAFNYHLTSPFKAAKKRAENSYAECLKMVKNYSEELADWATEMTMAGGAIFEEKKRMLESVAQLPMEPRTTRLLFEMHLWNAVCLLGMIWFLALGMGPQMGYLQSVVRNDILWLLWKWFLVPYVLGMYFRKFVAPEEERRWYLFFGASMIGFLEGITCPQYPSIVAHPPPFLWSLSIASVLYFIDNCIWKSQLNFSILSAAFSAIASVFWMINFDQMRLWYVIIMILQLTMQVIFVHLEVESLRQKNVIPIQCQMTSTLFYIVLYLINRRLISI